VCQIINNISGRKLRSYSNRRSVRRKDWIRVKKIMCEVDMMKLGLRRGH